MAKKEKEESFWTPAMISEAQSYGQKLRDNPQSIMPPLSGWNEKARSDGRDVLLSALMGFGKSQEAVSRASALGDPFSAALAGIAGSANQPGPDAIAAQRQQMDWENAPLGSISPDLAQEYGLDPRTPMGQLKNIMPLLQRQHSLEQQMALFSAAEAGRNSRNTETANAAAGRDEKRDERFMVTQEIALNEKFQGRQKDFFDIRDANSRLQELAKTAKTSPAASMALVYNFQKLSDPGSVVRETEFKNAEQARAWLGRADAEGVQVPSAVRLAIQKAQTGAGLLPEQVDDFTKTGNVLFTAQLKNYQLDQAEYKDFAKRLKLRPDNVAIDLSGQGSGGMVRMLSPKGKIGMMPEAHAEAAEAKGFRRIR